MMGVIALNSRKRAEVPLPGYSLQHIPRLKSFHFAVHKTINSQKINDSTIRQTQARDPCSWSGLGSFHTDVTVDALSGLRWGSGGSCCWTGSR